MLLTLFGKYGANQGWREFRLGTISMKTLTILFIGILTFSFNIQVYRVEAAKEGDVDTSVLPSALDECELREISRNTLPYQLENNSVFGYNDTLIEPDLPETRTTTSVPPIPGYFETSEFLIGSISVGVIFLESNGTIDTETENWTHVEESNVIVEIETGLNWLANQNPNANVTFTYDIHYSVPTSYEPINHPYTDRYLWIDDAMTHLGYSGLNLLTQVRNYINSLRDGLVTDWSFAIFVVDSSNDPDGCFNDLGPDKWSAFAYRGGPFLVMTYDNNGYGISNMDFVTAHETCHIFYATDEYNGETETSGYLGIQDNEYSGCMMHLSNTWWLCQASKEQLGWRDTDNDGIQDIVDTFSITNLNPYFPDPTSDNVLTYNGSTSEIPYPNTNPSGTGRDLTINTIKDVEFRINSGIWNSTIPIDNAFDENEEDYTFDTPSLLPGTYIIETRGINSVGNVETIYANDTVTVSNESLIYYDLTVEVVGSGTTVPAPGIHSVEEGTRVEVVSISDPGWHLDHFEQDGVNVGTGRTHIFTMNDDTVVTAVFVPETVGPYTLTVNIFGNGTVTLDPDQTTYSSGTSVTLTAEGNVGWNFTGWSGDLTGSDNPETLLMDSNKTVTATFSLMEKVESYLVVRGLGDGIYYRLYNSGEETWGNWIALPGSTCDSPASVVYDDKLYLAVRGMDGASLWFGSVDLSDDSFSGWSYLSGSTPSKPTLVSYEDKLILVVRGSDNRIYHRQYTILTESWGSWNAVPTGTTVDSPAATVDGDYLHLVVRGMDDGLYHQRIHLPTLDYLGWSGIGGTTPSTPTLASNFRSEGDDHQLYLIVRGSDDGIYLRSYDGSWSSWTSLPGSTNDAVGACIQPSKPEPGAALHIVVRGMTGGLYHGKYNLNSETFLSWTQISGSTPSPPTLTS